MKNEKIKTKHKGYPLFNNLHKENRISLLSNKSLNVDMNGFFNVLILIICNIHFRLIIENFKKYGLIIKFPKDLIRGDNIFLLLCFLIMHVSILFSWFIERYVIKWLYYLPNEKLQNLNEYEYDNESDISNYEYIKNIYDTYDNNCINKLIIDDKINEYKNVKNNKNDNKKVLKKNLNKRRNINKINGWKNFHLSIFILKFINSMLILYFPYKTITYYNTDPLLSTILLSLSIVWFFKLYSFHHVCYDIRKLYINYSNQKIYFQEIINNFKYIKNYPYCLTIKNFYIYILMPTMCFQFIYPRTKKIRWINLFKNTIKLILLLCIIKFILDQYIFITLHNTITYQELHSFKYKAKYIYIIERLLKISVPTLYTWLIGFLITFHYWCNILAEITKFGDRFFYNDWWNASSFGEYWRKWNLPVYYFINRHINKPLLYMGIKKSYVVIIIFSLSAMFHEYIINIPLKLGFNGYVFLAFICQIPLVKLTNHKFFRKHKMIGNSLFWFIFCFTGQPLVLFIYYYLWQAKEGKNI